MQKIIRKQSYQELVTWLDVKGGKEGCSTELVTWTTTFLTENPPPSHSTLHTIHCTTTSSHNTSLSCQSPPGKFYSGSLFPFSPKFQQQLISHCPLISTILFGFSKLTSVLFLQLSF